MKRVGVVCLVISCLVLLDCGGVLEPTPTPTPNPNPTPTPTPEPTPTPTPPPGWVLKYHETFDAAFDEPSEWVEDTYSDSGPYHVGPFDDNGEFFIERGGKDFKTALASFRSYRKSYKYGTDAWLTVELYGRDSDNDGIPESGGKFWSEDGRARLLSTRHYDGAIIRSTYPLPPRYRIELSISDIHFGGKHNGGWVDDNGHFNGYDEKTETGDPWRFTDGSTTALNAYHENGLYFLCIVDFANAAPHNNVLMHHHRKVVMDTDNNFDEWSYIYNPNTDQLEQDGSRYVSMIWLNGEDFGHDWVGNGLHSYIPQDGGKLLDGAYFADKYFDDETYLFVIERSLESYTLSVSGRFYYGGQRTYTHTKSFRTYPVVWHYNQTPQEYDIDSKDQIKTFNGKSYHTWPKDTGYPDYFLFGDPHINYYEGSARFDDLKLYVPAD